MKTWLSAVMFLLVLLVVCTARAQESESLGDVARKHRSEKKEPSKVVLTDQEHDEPTEPATTAANETSVCGAPLPIMQSVYVAALTGQKTPPEEDMAKELLGWLNDHPDLENTEPETLAKTNEPRTDAQEKADQDLADKIAQSFTDEMVEYKKNHTDEEVQEKLAKLMSATLPTRQADVLESAVRDEKRRREAATAPASDKDRLEQAINLYAICENKRLIVSQAEVEKISKASLKSKLEEAGFTLEQPAAGN